MKESAVNIHLSVIIIYMHFKIIYIIIKQFLFINRKMPLQILNRIDSSLFY